MKHLTVQTKATITDLGEFTAIAAAYSVDRANERIVPGAFADTIGSWQESGKRMPLHWDHSGDAKDIIGTVDPSSLRETAAGLQVSGQLDLSDSDVAREAWRLMRNDAAGLSFGYLVTDEAEGEDGVVELKGLDLFEISITPAPANPDTRILSMKAMTGGAERALRSMLGQAQEFVAADEPDPADRAVMAEIVDRLNTLLGEEQAETSQVAKNKPPDTQEVEGAEDEEPERPTPKAPDPLRDEIDLLQLGR